MYWTLEFYIYLQTKRSNSESTGGKKLQKLIASCPFKSESLPTHNTILLIENKKIKQYPGFPFTDRAKGNWNLNNLSLAIWMNSYCT